MNNATGYLIKSEHYLEILLKYLPRELYSIVRLTSKSFNRVIVQINNNSIKIITGHQLIRYLVTNGMLSLFEFVRISGCRFDPSSICDTAAHNGQLECLIHFRCKGYPCDDISIMKTAASRGHHHLMKCLHEEFACEWPYYICYYSASGGNVDCLIYGHQHGCKQGGDLTACVNRKVELGYVNATSSPLHAASQRGHLQMVRELLDRGADPNLPIVVSSPLIDAIRQGHTEIARLLLDRGADIQFSDLFGMNPLSLASLLGRLEIVRELLDRGADINARTNNGGWTALMHASHLNRLDVVRELSRRGADVTIASRNGDTALSLASKSGFNDIVRLLE